MAGGAFLVGTEPSDVADANPFGTLMCAVARVTPRLGRCFGREAAKGMPAGELAERGPGEVLLFPQ